MDPWFGGDCATRLGWVRLVGLVEFRSSELSADRKLEVRSEVARGVIYM